MRKVALFFTLCTMLFLAGCSTKTENPDNRSSAADYSHIEEFERYGVIEMSGKKYVMGNIYPKSDLAEWGVFRKNDNGDYELLLNIGAAAASYPHFFENGFFYLIDHNNLVAYNLTAESVEESKVSTTVIPAGQITALRYRDDNFLYVDAKLWNEEEARHDPDSHYKVARNGSGYDEITLEDIPKQ